MDKEISRILEKIDDLAEDKMSIFLEEFVKNLTSANLSTLRDILENY